MQDLYQHIFQHHEPDVTKAFQTRLRAAIKNLPQDNRQAITLHFIEKASRKEIAARLGWPLSKVNSKITRGVSLLKWELNPAAFEKAKQLFQETLVKHL